MNKAIYHKLPDFKKETRLIILAIVAYGLLLVFFPITVRDLSVDIKRGLGQCGAILLYTAGLFGGIGLTWQPKADNNRSLSEAKLKECAYQIPFLRKLGIDSGNNFDDQIAFWEKEKETAERELQTVSLFPKSLRYAGVVSLGFLAVGTVCQVMAI